MEELIKSLIIFREQNPEPGSLEMVLAINRIISSYDGIIDVTFSRDAAVRREQERTLSAIGWIKLRVSRQDYDLGDVAALYLHRFYGMIPEAGIK